MLHLARNPTIPLPIDVPLYDGLTPETGQAVNLSCVVMCLDNGYRLDADGSFKTSPTAPNFTMSAYTAFTNIYKHVFQPDTWPRGHYRAMVRHADGRDFAFDCTIGLYVNRKLGYSTVYTGTHLKLSCWVEENGDLQSDYTSLTEITITDMGGTVVATIPDNTSPVSGMFHFDVEVNLQANKHFIFKCKANAPGPAGFPTYTFPLVLGMARP